jgi:hypothetical protein
MIRAAERWYRVSIDLERHQLKLLRAELGLDPPPATTPTHDRTAEERRRVINQAIGRQDAPDLTCAVSS